MHKFIFFDVDDTLCDRTGVLCKCMRETWSTTDKEYPSICDEQEFSQLYLKHASTYLPREECFRLTLLSKGIENPSICAQLASLYEKIMEEELQLFDGAIETLKSLCTRFTLGVISNAPSISQRNKLLSLRIQQFFTHVVISSEVGVKKADRLIFEKALQMSKACPRESVYVGNDELLDVAGAKNAGLFTIWANMHQRKFSGSVSPDCTITSLPQLLTFL